MTILSVSFFCFRTLVCQFRIQLAQRHDSHVRLKLLEQLHFKSRQPMDSTRTPTNLLELKQQRLTEAADRKKRLITRLISVIGLLIILGCAIIVTLTLKMAPKIDELVRTKTGSHQAIHLASRSTTTTTTTTTATT